VHHIVEADTLVAAEDSLAVVVGNQRAVVEESPVVVHTVLVEDNLQGAPRMVSVDRRVLVEERHNPEVGPGRMAVVGDSLGVGRKELVVVGRANDLAVVDKVIVEVGRVNGLAAGTADLLYIEISSWLSLAQLQRSAYGLVDSSQPWWSLAGGDDA
jgi:hypothetical protein